MTTSKQAKLSITLKSVELIKELSMGLAPIGCIATRNFCDEISRTLINQAGEIDTMTAKVQNLATDFNSYEVLWDSLIFAIMGADGTADIINAADAERMTATAIAAVKNLATERDEKQRLAEAFQLVSNSDRKIMCSPFYKNGVHVGNIHYAADTDIDNPEVAEKISDEFEKTRKVGEFQNMFVYAPSDVSLSCGNSVKINSLIKKIRAIPCREERISGQRFNYTRLSEVLDLLAECEAKPAHDAEKTTLQTSSQTHELKIAPEYLEAVICGQKTAETRINDRDFKVNDHLLLREWENDGYTGWEHEVVITHVCDFPYVFTGEHWVSLSISSVYGLDPDAVNRYLNSRRAV